MQLKRTFLLGSALVLMGIGADAQIFGNGGYRNDPYYGNDPSHRDNGRYSRNRGYGNDPYYGNGGYANDPRSLVARVQSDVSRVANSSYADHHEQKHFSETMRNLDDFNNKLSRGRFDQGRLDKAMSSLSHLVNAQQIHPRDRNILANDLSALRSLRDNGGYNSGQNGSYGNGYPDNRRYDPYGYGR
ncbi:MAG TPA: hypothetical protein VMZ52_16980 [Bryobacteraceae bacterium]|nr:hypothetical protein [Bryobacteraceae bacterium]